MSSSSMLNSIIQFPPPASFPCSLGIAQAHLNSCPRPPNHPRARKTNACVRACASRGCFLHATGSWGRAWVPLQAASLCSIMAQPPCSSPQPPSPQPSCSRALLPPSLLQAANRLLQKSPATSRWQALPVLSVPSDPLRSSMRLCIMTIQKKMVGKNQ